MSSLARMNSRISEIREKSLSEERRPPKPEPNTAIGKRVNEIVRQKTLLGATLGLPNVRRFSELQGVGTSPRTNSLDSNVLTKYAQLGGGNNFQFTSGASPPPKREPFLEQQDMESFDRDSEVPTETELLL